MQDDVTYYQNIRSEMSRFLPAQYSKVLEIGCAAGGFSVNLKKDCELWGCEPDSISAETARKNYTKVLIGKYEDILDELPDNYFDLVICNDVIEHMIDHDFFLNSIKSKMADKGVLVASIPNVRQIRNLFNLIILKDWQYTDYSTLDRTHLRFFTEKSIKRTLAQHGFVTEIFSRINPSTRFDTKLACWILNILTLGYYSDISYMQFGIRVRKPD